MFFLEQEDYTEDEARVFLEAFDNLESNPLYINIVKPMVAVLEQPKNRRIYIDYGTEFLQANSVMLAKEYPTKAVSFPRLYVDNIFKLFGFDKKEFKTIVRAVLNQVNDKTAFQTIMASPTNIIHVIVLLYADMIQHRQLRDSARQQMGLSVYNNVFLHFFKPPHPIEATMGYVYLQLDNSWNLVKAENIINWIDMTIETAYQYWRTKMSLEMNPSILVQFLNRIRTSFRQNMRLIANKYFTVDEDKRNMIADDVSSDEMYFETKDTTRLRQNLVRRISVGDQLYSSKGRLYVGIAKLKNVKLDTLYEFAQTISMEDIGVIIDTILYVFIAKEGNTVDDINSTKFIQRITNLPTAIDRAVAGKPLITILSKKYKYDPSIIKAYICFLATYMMYRVNDAK